MEQLIDKEVLSKTAAVEDLYDLDHWAKETASWSEDPAVFISRYFTIHYEPQSHVYIRQPPNKLCILGLSTEHAAVKSKGDISCKFFFESKTKGQKVKPGTIICEITIDDQVYPIKATVFGEVAEVNPRVTEDANIIRTHALDEGYLAIIRPRSENSAVQLEGLIDQEAYNAVLNKT
jgi:glycine cleavage system H lipoate-binding protein